MDEIRTETNLNYKRLYEEYGDDVRKLSKELENTMKANGRHQSHLRFYLQCKHEGLVPKGLKIKAQMKSNEARKIIVKAEKALLNVRISEVIRKKDTLERKKRRVSEELKRRIPTEIHTKLIEINERRQYKELKKSSERQKKKCKRLKDIKEQRNEERTTEEERNEERTTEEERETSEESNETEINEQNATNEADNRTIHRVHTNNSNADQNNNNELNAEDGGREIQNGDENAVTNENNEERRSVNEEIDELEEDPDKTIAYDQEEEEEDEDSKEEAKERWVKNLSNRPLSKDEVNLLRKGGGFAVTPSELPIMDYITAIEQACRNLAKGEANCLRAEMIEDMEKAKLPKSNLTKRERLALKTLRDDENIMVLPADKGKCMVIMERKEYLEKMEEKLKDETTYKRIEKDPTNDIKESLSKLLNKIKDEKQIDMKTFYRLQPTKAKIPRMYGLPKIHKENHPLREIVDSTGSVVKETDRYVSKIIQQYTGKTEHFVKNSAHFVEMTKDLTVDEDEILVSYDVEALFPSVPQGEAIDLFYQMMKNDKDLDKKTTMTAENVIELFKTCVQTTYFVFNQNLFKQVNGLAIGAASSGPAADLFMENLEKKAITTFVEPPKIWKRYVDDTFTKLKMIRIDAFLKHLNQQHPRIKFTTEIQQQGKIAFLDTLVHVLEDGSTKVTIYRKATHTDQYLDFSSNHHIKQKTGIYRTFEHRVNEIITTEEDKKKEMKHVRKSLRSCGHSTWTLKERKKEK